jgi:hypothetical protein
MAYFIKYPRSKKNPAEAGLPNDPEIGSETSESLATGGASLSAF